MFLKVLGVIELKAKHVQHKYISIDERTGKNQRTD